MTARIKAIAAKENIPIKQAYASVCKEALVSEILSTRGDAPGIVCILSAIEIKLISVLNAEPCNKKRIICKFPSLLERSGYDMGYVSTI